MNVKKYFFAILIAVLVLPAAAKASEAKITFRFDDGLMSQYDIARPILAKYNYPASLYVFTDPLQEGNWEGYMKWQHLYFLQNLYGWEIGSHSKSHPYLTQLSDEELIEEIKDSQDILKQHGFFATGFVSPFGHYNNKVIAAIARFYQNHGSAWPLEANSYPYNDYNVSVKEPLGTTSVEEVKSWIDQAQADGKWLVLLFHNIVEEIPSTYDYSKQGFEQIVDYVNQKNMPVVTVKQGLALPNNNLVQNPSFNIFLDNYVFGWTAGNHNVAIDKNNKGSYPSSKNSLKIVGQPLLADTVRTKNFIDVSPNESYIFKVYFNCQDFVSGGVDVFFDEYDKNENWLNWTWKTGIWSAFAGQRVLLYTPSPGAEKLLVWFQAPAGSDLTCHVDNVTLIPVFGRHACTTLQISTSVSK